MSGVQAVVKFSIRKKRRRVEHLNLGAQGEVGGGLEWSACGLW